MVSCLLDVESNKSSWQNRDLLQILDSLPKEVWKGRTLQYHLTSRLHLPPTLASWDPDAAKPAAGSVMLPGVKYLRSTPKRQTANILISHHHALMMTCLELRLRWHKGWLLLVKRCEKRTYQKSVLRISSRNHNLSLHVNMTESKYGYHCYLVFLFECQGTTKRERCWTHTFFFFTPRHVELLGEKIALHGSLLWDLGDHSCHSPARHLRQHHSKSVNRHQRHPPATPSRPGFWKPKCPSFIQDDPRSRGDYWSASTSVHVTMADMSDLVAGWVFGYRTRPGTFVGFQPGGGRKKITSSSSWSACTTGSSGFLTPVWWYLKILCLVKWNWENQEHTHTTIQSNIMYANIYIYKLLVA